LFQIQEHVIKDMFLLRNQDDDKTTTSTTKNIDIRFNI